MIRECWMKLKLFEDMRELARKLLMDFDTVEVKRGEVRGGGADICKTPELFRTSGAQDVEPLSNWC